MIIDVDNIIGGLKPFFFKKEIKIASTDCQKIKLFRSARLAKKL